MYEQIQRLKVNGFSRGEIASILRRSIEEIKMLDR